MLDNPSHVTVSTSMGDITIELYWKHAPKTCKNFAELSRKKYYNNTIFHRIIPGFMVQGGDPTGELIYKDTFNDLVQCQLSRLKILVDYILLLSRYKSSCLNQLIIYFQQVSK